MITVKTAYSYNYDGSIHSITYDKDNLNDNEETVVFAYNSAGHLVNVTGDGEYIKNMEYTKS